MKTWLTSAALALGVLSAAVWGESTQAVDKLSEKLSDLTSLEGTFTQSLRDESDSELERSSGTFVVQKPGRFYWRTTDPYPQTLVSNGETVWLYDPDLMQVTVRQMSDDMQRTPALLLSDSAARIADAYHVNQPEDNRFVLTPKESDPLFESLTLVFAAQRVAQIQLLDSLGQTTVFTFSATKINKPVSEDLFEFDIPDDVDILIE
ncbi:outer membrane lipoprotein chaperone LolA [Gilvimarinus xylanilyticus]|uniref:Outer-membrane lipoprotein carrier protein n=1 Tax=Gilvimarinus xylanilyticus TaxID=2944139 RepID=A0A9X2I290_9GAMM|nr:outer membrane lipoprotein chaperone LolA [Gilvimarinus xylanilyticus]MCP8898177.1 outer membrane lipoprotein chaperone LolA [Gilvimarinus xylanilyticus]